MYTEDINKAYVSEIDKFLHEFDKKNPKSNSQHKEIRKHSRIAQLRDGHTRNGLQQLTDRV